VKEYAMEFIDITKEKRHSLNILIQTLKKMGAKNRLEVSTPLPDEELDKTVSNTPYKIVLFFRKLILKDVGRSSGKTHEKNLKLEFNIIIICVY